MLPDRQGDWSLCKQVQSSEAVYVIMCSRCQELAWADALASMRPNQPYAPCCGIIVSLSARVPYFGAEHNNAVALSRSRVNASAKQAFVLVESGHGVKAGRAHVDTDTRGWLTSSSKTSSRFLAESFLLSLTPGKCRSRGQ